MNSGIVLKASAVFNNIGGIPSNANAISAGLTPVPTIGINIIRTAKLGIILRVLNQVVIHLHQTLFLVDNIPKESQQSLLQIRIVNLFLSVALLPANNYSCPFENNL